MIYRGQDGREKFTDTGPRIVMHDKKDDSLEAALRVAAQKYGGKVDITGSSEFRERAARQAVRLGIKVANEDLQAVVADEQARMRAEHVPNTQRKEQRSGQTVEVPRKAESTEQKTTVHLSPDSGDNPKAKRSDPAPQQRSTALPKKRADSPSPVSQPQAPAQTALSGPVQVMVQAVEQWLDGNHSTATIKTFIAAYDQAKRQGGNGQALAGEVTDHVLARRGKGSREGTFSFFAAVARERDRELGRGR